MALAEIAEALGAATAAAGIAAGAATAAAAKGAATAVIVRDTRILRSPSATYFAETSVVQHRRQFADKVRVDLHAASSSCLHRHVVLLGYLKLY